MNAVHSFPLGSFRTKSLKASGHGHARLADRLTVVFDLDGTLVDTAPDLTASLNHCLRLAGIVETTVDQVRPHAGRGAQVMLSEAYRSAGRLMDEAEQIRQTECFLAHYADHIAVASTLYPGAIRAMDRLAASGATLAVCTNKTERLARRLLDALNLTDRFAAICGADTFAARKPDPVHLLGTIALAGGSDGAAVMIGDTETDIETASRAGVPSILVEFGYDPDRAARARATGVIGTYDDLDMELIANLMARPSATVVRA